MFTKVELFAGAGGLALGLEQAGFEALLLNDFDESACKTLKLNRPNWNVRHEDISKLSNRDLLKELSLKYGELDLLSGGYPCQSFSYAGKRLGIEDVRGTMFYYYAQVLKQLYPKTFLAENVRGLFSHDNGRTLKTMIDVFADVGYDVFYKVLNAWDYGVSQKRERIVIIGTRKDLNLKYEFPKPYKYKPILRDALKDVPLSAGAKYPESKRKILDLVPPGGCWRHLPDNLAKEYMQGSYFLGGGKTGMARRISWDEPSLTLTCSPAQKQTERCHPDETRPFTVREYARIQSFPDSWQFSGTITNQYKQIGNAVPVNFAKEIGLSIIKALTGGEYKMHIDFISDENLEKHIKATLDYYRETIEKIDLAKFNSNIVDPIKLTFDSIVYNKEIETIISEEIARQRDKSNTNAIGYFHQNLFSYIKNCTVLERGFDILFDNNKQKIYVELKNKHNTMNSSSSQKTFMRMLAKVSEEQDCECYLVEIIARKSQNITWNISLDSTPISNPRIKRVSVDKFYEIITGDKNAFMKLCKVLPKVISKVVGETLAKDREEDSVFEELKQKDEDILKALYLLAFKTYEGFDSF